MVYHWMKKNIFSSPDEREAIQLFPPQYYIWDIDNFQDVIRMEGFNCCWVWNNCNRSKGLMANENGM